ncbi:MAG: AcrB/AcrD/AcrF family protein [Alphaproteobacteria bacterium]|nr:AcrB/AcrD/AcrF family protein [Alphaproteobacteria bacterium]
MSDNADTGKFSIIRLFASHRTAANLLMLSMILVGIFALRQINTQFFPDFGLDIISISVEWRGASAEDIDSNIIQALDPEVRFLDGVRRVQSSSVEGHGQIVIEFDAGTDMQSALSNIETAVGQVTTLPEDSETPEIRRLVRYDTISRIVISGPYPESSLKEIGKRLRDDLLNSGSDKVDLFGARDEEIWVEVAPETLREFDLTLGDIAERIAETSQDLPSGDTTGSAERQIRSLGLRKDALSLGRVEVRALENGEKIQLHDIAAVSERFEEGGKTARRFGEAAVELHVRRAVNADALKVAKQVDAYIEKIRPELPPNLRLERYDVQSDLIKGCINLLLVNGGGGLVLVLLILFVFLNTPTAFWVAVGIPTSLMATVVVMELSGQSINMVSLFGLIMAPGIIVDDAIVVGEHAAFRARSGEAPLDAAVNGARRMAAPVFSSSLTTIAAFIPLLVISDIIGQIIRSIPLVIIAVIVASLIECFFVLPGHMRGALSWNAGRRSRPRIWFNNKFDAFRDGPFNALVHLVLRWRYATLAVAIGGLILSVGLVAGGRVGFVFFPSPEADRVYANVQFTAGSPRERTIAMLAELERSLAAAEQELTNGEGGLIRMALSKVGASVGQQTPLPGSGDHIGGLAVEMTPSDERDIRTATLVAAWRKHVRLHAGTEFMTIRQARGGPPGREVDIRLAGADLDSLKAAATEIRLLLAEYPGVTGVEDNLPFGKRETILEVTPTGRALGFNTQSVGRQVRNAFEGAIAKRFSRDDEEVTVRVRFPRNSVDTASLDGLYLRGPGGAEVLLDEVVSATDKSGFSRIRREDGVRQVAITADTTAGITTTDKVIEALNRDGIQEIVKRYGLKLSFAGKAEEQARTIADMQAGAMLGLAGIYIILAWVFSSYFRPIAVMAIIPLGFVGATLGHWLLGYELTILSIMALVGLSGIVINDSIILVSTIDERLDKGEPMESAIVDGTRDRLRAVILTSATTMGGLTPLMFERSLQAQFLIPMAITMVFGLMVTTFLVLLVVPALIRIQHDFGTLYRWLRGSRAVSAAAE